MLAVHIKHISCSSLFLSCPSQNIKALCVFSQAGCSIETAMPSVYFCPLLNLATSSTFKSAECGSHSALLVVSVVLLCINNSTSVATSNKHHRAQTRLAVPIVGVDFLVSSAQSTISLCLDIGLSLRMLLLILPLYQISTRLSDIFFHPSNTQLYRWDGINSVKAEPCLTRLSLEPFSSFSMEDNEAASGEVMLNNRDPLLALVKCQWNEVKPSAKLSCQHVASLFLLRPFKAPSLEHLCLLC